MGPHINRRLVFLFLGIAFILFRTSFAFSEQIIIDSAAQFDFARSCMENGQYEMAVMEFERFIHFFPDNHRVSACRRLIGTCHMENQRFEAARKSFFDIINSESNSTEVGKALLFIGESYYRQDIPAEADHYFAQIIEKCPHPELKNAALYRLGWTCMQSGKWASASETFSMVEETSVFHTSALELSKQSLLGEKLPYKRPACAGTLAALMPGLGHAYVSRYRDATVAFLLNGLFIWAAAESFHQGHDALGGILTFFEVGWYTGNIYSAVNCAHKHNRKLKNDFRNNLKDQFDIGFFAAAGGAVGMALTFQF